MLKRILVYVLMFGLGGIFYPDISFTMTPRQAFYYYASQGNMQAIYQLQQMGFPIDVADDYGNSALCEAVIKQDQRAIQTLVKLGADTGAYCMQALGVDQILSDGTINTIESNQKDKLLSKEMMTIPNPPAEPMTKNTKVGIGLGVVALAGAGTTAALLLSGGGGGGSSHLNCVDGVQKGKSCICNPHATGKLCDSCEAGYGMHGTNSCHADKTCKINAHQAGDDCVCDEGYDFEGTSECFPDLGCDKYINMKQSQTTGQCVCDKKESGKEYVILTGGCFEKITCPEHSSQSYNTCVCDSDYPVSSGSGTSLTCSQCPEHSSWNGSACVCNSDYPVPSGSGTSLTCSECPEHSSWNGSACVCDSDYPVISGEGADMSCSTCEDAKPHSSWDGSACVCNESYPHEYSNQCYEILECAHGTQQGASCSCPAEEHWTGTLCDKCETGYVLWKGECIPAVNSSQHAQYNNNKAIQITAGQDNKGDVIGLWHEKLVYGAQGGNYSLIDLVNTEKGSVYGIYGNVTTTDEDENVIAGFTYQKNKEDIIQPFKRDEDGNSVGYQVDVQDEEYKYLDNTTGGDIYATKTSSGLAESVISITTNQADAYGMYGFKNVYGGYAESSGQSDSKILITSSGGNITGLYGITPTKTKSAPFYNIYGSYGDNASATTSIVLTNSNGNSYGIKATEYRSIRDPNTWNPTLFGAYGNATTNITLKQNGGNAYGLFGEQVFTSEPSPNATGKTNITLELSGSASGYGIFTPGSSSVSRSESVYTSKGSSITIHPKGENTKSYGIYTGRYTSVINNANITIDGQGSAAYGIYVNSDGMPYSSGTTAKYKPALVNKGNITIKGEYNKAYGIYVNKIYQGFSLINEGTIDLSGVTGRGNNPQIYPIYFEQWYDNNGNIHNVSFAYFINKGTLILPSKDSCSGNDCKDIASMVGELTEHQKENSDDNIDYSEMELIPAYTGTTDESKMFFPVLLSISSGSTTLTTGALKGTIYVDPDLTTQGFDTTYIGKDMISADDTSGLQLKSDSALFDAKLAENGKDVVMTMKGFDTATNNKSLANFLSKNYSAGNNEAFFNKLKSFGDTHSLTDSLNKLTGRDMLSRFNFEDMTMMRELNYDMNEKLFHNKEQHFALAGSVSPMAFKGDTGSNARYSLFNKRDGNKSIGLGIAFTDVRSDDTHEDNDRHETSYQLILPLGYRAGGFNLVTSPRIGYARGTYDRTGFDGTNYDGTIEKRVFGLMNEARYPITVGKWKLEPSAEFNILGYQQKGYEDAKEFALNIQNQNTLSVEGGIGLYATREEELDKDTTLKLTAGMAAYHEFADPYRVKVGMRGMDGAFTLRDEKRSDNRGVIRAGFDYAYRDLSLYGSLVSYIDREARTSAKTGMKVKF